MQRPDQPRRYCKKCLTPQTGEAFFQRLREIIAGFDEEEKVPREVYEKRLDACMSCDRLLAGMCRICGCYVELRASLKRNACPAVHPKWEVFPEENTEGFFSAAAAIQKRVIATDILNNEIN